MNSLFWSKGVKPSSSQKSTEAEEERKNTKFRSQKAMPVIFIELRFTISTL